MPFSIYIVTVNNSIANYMVLELIKGKQKGGEADLSEFPFKPYVKKALDNIAGYVLKQKAKKNILGILEFQNLSTIIYSYGANFCERLIDIVKEIFLTSFQDKVYLEKISIEGLLFCIKEEEEAAAYNLLNEVFKQLRNLTQQIPDKPVYLCFNCGTAVMHPDVTLEETTNQAYIALFECKSREGYTHCTFDEDVRQKMLQHENHMRLAAYFQKAIAENRLRLAFQPIVDSKSGKVKHHESLLRIVTEENKIISAGPFIPIAEKMRFIDQIDFLVLDLVVKELKFNPNVFLAMNISNLSIDNIKWLDKAKQLLKDSSIASRLIVEITETSMHKELSKVAHFVDTLQGLGCMVAIDDFGAGYTSFTQLKIIHADLIKIDGIFIRDIVDNHDSRLFVQTLLEFARGFGIKTVAEFVENGEIAKALIDLNIDFMQGNYFSPAVNYRTWVKDDAYKLLN